MPQIIYLGSEQPCSLQVQTILGTLKVRWSAERWSSVPPLIIEDTFYLRIPKKCNCTKRLSENCISPQLCPLHGWSSMNPNLTTGTVLELLNTTRVKDCYGFLCFFKSCPNTSYCMIGPQKSFIVGIKFKMLGILTSSSAIDCLLLQMVDMVETMFMGVLIVEVTLFMKLSSIDFQVRSVPGILYCARH